MKRTFTVSPRPIKAAEEFPIDNPFEGWTKPTYQFNPYLTDREEIEEEIENGLKAKASYDEIMVWLDALEDKGNINDEERTYYEGFTDEHFINAASSVNNTKVYDKRKSKFMINGEEVKIVDFNKAAKKALDYNEYLSLFEGEEVRGFSIEVPGDGYEWEVGLASRGDGEWGDINSYTIAKTKEEAIHNYLEVYPEESKIYAWVAFVMPEYRFNGYRSEDDMYNDYYPSRPY